MTNRTAELETSRYTYKPPIPSAYHVCTEHGTGAGTSSVVIARADGEEEIAVRTIPLDADFIQELMKGHPLYERRANDGGYYEGEILAIKETYSYGAHQYLAELDLENHRGLELWRYARTMPHDMIKRFVRVDSVKRVEEDEYKEYLKTFSREILYDNRKWFGKNIPYHRWFRDGKPSAYPAKFPVVIVKFSFV